MLSHRAYGLMGWNLRFKFAVSAILFALQTLSADPSLAVSASEFESLLVLLGRYESLPNTPYCLNGGIAFRKRNKDGFVCSTVKTECPQGYVKCQAGMVENQCVPAHENQSTVEGCRSLMSAKEVGEFLKFLNSPNGHELLAFWKEQAQLVCDQKIKPRECSILKSLVNDVLKSKDKTQSEALNSLMKGFR